MKPLTKEHKFHSIDLKMEPHKDNGYFSTVEIDIAGQTLFITVYETNVYNSGKSYHGKITDSYFGNPERSKESKSDEVRKRQFDKEYKALTHAEAMFEILYQLKQFDEDAFKEALTQVRDDLINEKC